MPATPGIAARGSTRRRSSSSFDPSTVRRAPRHGAQGVAVWTQPIEGKPEPGVPPGALAARGELHRAPGREQQNEGHRVEGGEPRTRRA